MNDPEAVYQAELAHRKAGIAAFAAHVAQAAVDLREWRVVADHVLAGDYRNATRSELQSIHRGLAAFQDPLCQQAAEAVRKRL